MGKVDITHQQLIFRDSIGQKATVSRERATREASEHLDRMLIDIGHRIVALGTEFKVYQHLSRYEYLGSAAVHVFYQPTLKQLDLLTQASPLTLYRCPEEVAAKAVEDLIREVKSVYGKRHSKLRSGF